METLADKVADLLLREDYGQMPVMKTMVPFEELEEYNTSTIDMGAIGNKPLPAEYYLPDKFSFSESYSDFLSLILGKPNLDEFKYDFPAVKPV